MPRLAEADLGAVAGELRGVFGLFVHDRVRNGWQIACDNAGICHLYHDERGVGTSFLELTADRGLGVGQVDLGAVTEYLAQAGLHWGRTWFADVKKLRQDEVVELTPGQAPRLLTKRLPPPLPVPTQGEAAFSDYFADLAQAVGDERLSLDITMGFDTRLVLAMLAHAGLDFELAVSGRDSSPDVRMARQVAQLLGRPLHVAGHDLSGLDKGLQAAFLAGDGLSNPYRLHRLRQHTLARKERGVSLALYGGGGEILKDFYWLQDFPHYSRAGADLERLYRWRLEAMPVPAGYLTPEAQRAYAEVRPRTLAIFRTLQARLNTETYDRVYCQYRAPEFYGRVLTPYLRLGVPYLAPLIDHDAARIAMGLPRWQRFMNGFHRAMITQMAPELADLPTSDRYTARAGWSALAPALAGYGGNIGRRFLKKMSQRFRQKPAFHQVGSMVNDDASYLKAIRASRSYAEAVTALKRHGVLAQSLEPAQVRNGHVARVLTCGMTLAYLETREQGSSAR